ncbi:hypothetical protein [Eubacterium sp.]
MLSNQILSSYEALRDEKSRYIFRCRLMYLFNDDIREIYKIIDYKSRMPNGEAICNNSNTLARLILNNCVTKDPVYIVGINRIGKLVYDYLKRVGINVATFIDDGSELRALQGAENIIKKNKPKLAISVYKNKRDILDILVYIHNLVPEYNLYLRHYSDFEYDTVLYACV